MVRDHADHRHVMSLRTSRTVFFVHQRGTFVAGWNLALLQGVSPATLEGECLS